MASHKGCSAQLRRLIQRLAEVGPLRSPDQMNKEGDGIFAIKARCGLRVYGWFAEGAFVIGHATLKKKQKADTGDLDKTKRERDLYRVER